MEGIFIKLLNLSIQASILITVVLLLRFILNKSPKSIKCLLWALVAIRLVCPFSIESKFSLAPDAEVVSMDNYVGMPNVLSKTTGSDRYVKGYAESYDHEVVTVEKKNTDPLHIFSIIWLGGVVILAVYALGSCLKIWRRVKLSIRTTENIYICDRIDSPFIFGIIKPRIYLPSRMNEEQKESVIAHERAHLKRLDHFWKPFGFGLLSVYWFNPLCWLAYILFCRDIELACDEKVIKDMDAKQKKIYSKKLLICMRISSSMIVNICPDLCLQMRRDVLANYMICIVEIWQSRREKLLLFLQKMNTMERELRFLKKRVS